MRPAGWRVGSPPFDPLPLGLRVSHRRVARRSLVGVELAYTAVALLVVPALLILFHWLSRPPLRSGGGSDPASSEGPLLQTRRWTAVDPQPDGPSIAEEAEAWLQEQD